jgi:hypothetical protein
MNKSVKLQIDVPFTSGTKKKDEHAPAVVSPPRTPRISKMMALAIYLDGLICNGNIRNQTDLADIGQVTRARASQVLKLLHLAPDIQEALLFMDITTKGRNLITERNLRSITAVADWQVQRLLWSRLHERLVAPASDNAPPVRRIATSESVSSVR